MDVQANSRPIVTQFGAKLAGVVLLSTLLALLLGDYFLASVLRYLRELPPGFYSLQGSTDNQIGALRSIASGFINPVLILLIAALLLKRQFRREPIAALCTRLGMQGIPRLVTFVSSFAVGIAYVFTFTAVRHFFPPNEFAAPHPENIVNYAMFTGKVLFVLGACISVPIAEEILFRGVLYQGIANSWGKVASVVLTSLAFIALHPGSISTGYWATHAELYLAPLLMVAMREVTGTLYASIATHSGINFGEIFF